MTDELILKTIREGNIYSSEKAFRYLYKHYYAICEQLVLKNSGTPEDAEDIFQEAMVIFYNNVKKTEFLLSSKISSYLYAVARNLWFKNLRSAKNFANVDQDFIKKLEGGVVLLDEDPIAESTILLSKLLEEAGERCLKLLKMFYYEKHKMLTISEVLGFSTVQIAKNQKVRCLKKIRTIFKNNEKYKHSFNL